MTAKEYVLTTMTSMMMNITTTVHVPPMRSVGMERHATLLVNVLNVTMIKIVKIMTQIILHVKMVTAMSVLAPMLNSVVENILSVTQIGMSVNSVMKKRMANVKKGQCAIIMNVLPMIR